MPGRDGRRLRAGLALASVLAAVSLLGLPGIARAVVYCVPNTTIDPSCGSGDSLQPALSAAANSTAVADTVLLGPGVHVLAGNQGYNSAVVGNEVQIRGQGMAATTLSFTNTTGTLTGFLFTAPAGSTLEDLTINMGPNLDASGNIALNLGGSSTTRDVHVDTSAHTNSVGVQLGSEAMLDDSSVDTGAGADNYAARSTGGHTTITDSELTGQQGVNQYGAGTSVTVKRSTIDSRLGLSLDAGTINVADSVIDLGAHAGAAGIQAANFNDGTDSMTVAATNVTIVGGGAGSIGVRSLGDSGASAPGDPDDMVVDGETATVTLSSSVIDGPLTSIEVAADRGESATVTSSYSNYTAPSVEDDDISDGNATGFATLTETNKTTHAVPGFVNPGAGDYHLLATSPLIDAGDPAPATPGLLDIDGDPRALDGVLDCFATARRDIGADEFTGGGQLDCIAPDTTVSGKRKLKSKRKKVKVSFTLGATEDGSSFECSLDGAAFAACASPYTRKAKRGKHTLSVRARDASGNADATPATLDFKVTKKKAKKK